MNRIAFILGLMVIGLSSLAQPYTLDLTFQPAFNIRNNTLDIGPTNDLWENPQSGTIYIVGGFKIPYPGQQHGGISSMLRDGSRNLNFSFNGGSSTGISHIFKRPGSELVTSSNNGYYVRRDTTGSVHPSFNQWAANFINTAKCSEAYVPYFFDDGSYLISKDFLPNGCQIINPPDTFPHRYIVKVTPQGLWDSSFVKDATGEPTHFVPYDSNRMMVYGSPSVFTHYDGVPIHGMCRIYLDGTLDTTFQSPLGTFSGNTYNVVHIDTSGSIFLGGIYGYFNLRSKPNSNFTLIKLNPDGSLDNNFANFQGPTQGPNVLGSTSFINAISPTEDGGYLVGGFFDNYQGFSKHNLAKIDSNGHIEPQYFNTHGPDSASMPGITSDSMGFVRQIKKSAFGGYYVMGNFFTWDGAPVQGIVRIKDMTVGEESPKLKAESLKLYPNPTENQITLSSALPIEEFEIFDLVGKKVKQVQLQNTYQYILNLQRLDNGLYFVKVKVGEVWVTKKVVKQ
tara:strand:- start:3314 stop:4837 length:1524 start_codon:yes stop_codon:yes gene_type:complete